MGPRSEDPKLIIRVIIFELVEPICPRYVNVTDDRGTDGRTDGRHRIAIPRLHYVHRAVKTYSRTQLSRKWRSSLFLKIFSDEDVTICSGKQLLKAAVT